MSKRVANTRANTARKNRIRRSWRYYAHMAKKHGVEQKERVSDITRKPKQISLWKKIKNYVRRHCGKS